MAESFEVVYRFIRRWNPPDSPRYSSQLLDETGQEVIGARQRISEAACVLAGGRWEAHGRKFRVTVELLPGTVALPDPNQEE